MSLWLLAGAVVIAPPSAAAQERTPTPSARELWETYPLHTRAPSATPTAAEQERRAAAPGPPARGDAGSSVVVPALAGAALLVLAGGFVMLRRRSGARSVLSAPAGQVASAVAAVAGTAALPDRGPRSPQLIALASGPPDEEPKRDDPPFSRAIRPPDPERAWTAEIEWRDERGGPCFGVAARPEGDQRSVFIASSDPLTWPPPDAAAVERMRGAVARMEAALAASGWRMLEPGSSWYSKRFAWEPVKTRRFARQADWTPGDDLWRCEIEWQAGYVRSRFRAVAHAPGERRGTTIGTSEPFKWLFMDQPDPSDAAYRGEVRRLDVRMTAAGWEPAGQGARWYALRYVWRRDGPPPTHLELAPAEVDGA